MYIIYISLSSYNNSVNEPKSSRSLQTSDCDRQTVARRSRVRAKESKGKCIGFDRFLFCFFRAPTTCREETGSVENNDQNITSFK